MAGFLGWVRRDGAEAEVAGALACLRHHPSFQARVLAGDARAGVGVVYRENDPPEVFEDAAQGLLVAILGAVLESRAGGWHRFTAQELARLYAARGLGAVSGLDGAYQLLIRDEPAGQIHVLNDRVGNRPVQWAAVHGSAAFAPEGKALFRLLPLKPRLDFTGMVSFLNLGYPVGTYTLFEGVWMLAPAHRLSLNWHTGQVQRVRTWVQRFEPDKHLSLRAAVDLLYEAILEAHRAPLGVEGERSWIAMTGGYDSRVMLHFLKQTGHKCELSVTWGATDTEPNSDPTVARALATACGIPHRFFCYGAENVALHARNWIVISELGSDNPGYFAAGPELLYVHNNLPTNAVYIGDAVIASGGLPHSLNDALTTVLRCPFGQLHYPLQNVLRAEARVAAASAFWQAAHLVAEGCPTDEPEHIQDYLWSAIYNFRWLFSPGFYKEPMLTARRPMLLGPAYDALARIPAALRVYRRVYMEMVQSRLPPAFRVPRAEVDSLVDWQYDSRREPSFRTFLVDGTKWAALAATPLGELLDRGATEAMVAAYFSREPRPMRRQPSGLNWRALRRRFAATPLLGDLFRWGQRMSQLGMVPRSGRGNDATRLLFRLTVLVELHQAITDGLFTGERGSIPRQMCDTVGDGGR